MVGDYIQDIDAQLHTQLKIILFLLPPLNNVNSFQELSGLHGHYKQLKL